MIKPEVNAMSWNVFGYLPREALPVVRSPKVQTGWRRDDAGKLVTTVVQRGERRTRIEHFSITYASYEIRATADGPALRKDYQEYATSTREYWYHFCYTKKLEQPWGLDGYLAKWAPDHEYAHIPEWLAAIVEANMPEALKEIWK